MNEKKKKVEKEGKFACRVCGHSSYSQIFHQHGKFGGVPETTIYACDGCSAAFSDPETFSKSRVKKERVEHHCVHCGCFYGSPLSIEAWLGIDDDPKERLYACDGCGTLFILREES